MSAAGAVARGRALAESLMVDACTIRRSTGTATDDNTGEVTPTWDDVYAGKCRVQQQTTGSQAATAGQDYQLLQRLEVQLPMSVTGVEVGDEVTITAAALDAALAGQVFLVRDLFAKTHATARRLGVTRRTS
jgi:hypothetical protein